MKTKAEQIVDAWTPDINSEEYLIEVQAILDEPVEPVGCLVQNYCLVLKTDFKTIAGYEDYKGNYIGAGKEVVDIYTSPSSKAVVDEVVEAMKLLRGAIPICRCGKEYTGRNLTAPDCPFCAFSDIECEDLKKIDIIIAKLGDK